MFVIAGVTGHVGGAAATQLLAQKQPVKVIVRDAAKGKEWGAKGAEVAVGKLDDAGFLAGALKATKGFFTLLPPDLAAPDFYSAQKHTADAIAVAVKTSGVPHVVMLSSIGGDLAEGTGPIKGLHYLEEKLRTTGAKLTIIRAGSFQENVANALTPAKMMGIYPSFSPSPDYPVAQIATKDIGALVAKSLRSPPSNSEVVDLQGPTYSDKDIAEKLGKALGKPLQVVSIPPQGQVQALMQGGFSKHLAEVFAEMYAAVSAGKVTPKGDRLEKGATTLDEVILDIVR